MSKRKRIIALLVGVILLAGTAGTLAWLSVTGVLVNQFGKDAVSKLTRWRFLTGRCVMGVSHDWHEMAPARFWR